MRSVDNKKILVVDDDPHVLEAYDEILVSPGDDDADELLHLLTEEFSLDESESQLTVDQAKLGFDVSRASSGEEAIKIFKKAYDQGEPFSTVFIDIRMPPGMDGIECSGKLRDIDPRAYMVIVSAYSDYSLDEIDTHIGNEFIYLRKPFIPEELYQVARVFSNLWGKDAEKRERISRLEYQLDECKSRQ